MPRQRWVHGLTRDGGPAIHFVQHGAGDPVILLHGFPDFWYMWRHQIPVFAAHGFRVIAVDMRGYNRSDAPAGIANYSIDKLCDDVVRVMHAVGVESAHIVGHDWGGIVAWNLAIKHPSYVKKLIVINAPHPKTFVRALFSSSQILRSWYVAAFQLPGIPEIFLQRRRMRVLRKIWYAAGRRSGTVTEDDIVRYTKAFSKAGRLTAALNYYRAALRSLIASRGNGLVSSKTLIVWGARDKFLVPGLAKAAGRWVPNLTIIDLPASGHWPQLDDVTAVNDAIVNFLQTA